ncbi:hypothetical protein TREES_T100021725 [Tupaia chinensis]|uniref:Uncharacterized protein n=1 Tax=Tupaia chinensis TaxID=246437 RepID=L9JK96_TUPCH|nr:hypothetical protein TREES_T100021725 [Tupaia chinensis]
MTDGGACVREMNGGERITEGPQGKGAVRHHCRGPALPLPGLLHLELREGLHLFLTVRNLMVVHYCGMNRFMYPVGRSPQGETKSESYTGFNIPECVQRITLCGSFKLPFPLSLAEAVTVNSTFFSTDGGNESLQHGRDESATSRNALKLVGITMGLHYLG